MKIRLNKFAKDSIVTILNRGLESVFWLAISIIIARTLGAEGKGIYTLAILLPSLLLIFCNLGITSSSVYYTAKNKYKISEILTGNSILIIAISFATTIIGVAVIIFLSDLLFPSVDKKYLYMALSIVPASILFDYLANIIIGLQKIVTYNVIYLVKNVLFLIFAVVVLLGFKFDVGSVIIAQAVALFIGGIIYFILIRKVDCKLPRFNWKYLKDVVVFGFKTYLAGIVTYLQYRINVLIINIFQTPVAVGFYSVATQLSESTWLIPRSVSTVLSPIIASDTKDSFNDFAPMVCRIVLILVAFLSLVLFALSHFIVVLLYSTTFIEAINPLRILLIGSIAFCGQIILINAMVAYGKPMIITIISAITLSINVGLNIWFIPMWGIIGAAWASSIANSLSFIVTAIVYSKIANISVWSLFRPKISDMVYIKNIIKGVFND